MRAQPRGKMIVGRVVDTNKTEGGLHLATSEIRNITCFLLVDAVGPEVAQTKVGDIVLYKAGNHIWWRGGYHRLLVHEDEIMCDIEDLDMSTVLINGEPAAKVLAAENGTAAQASA